MPTVRSLCDGGNGERQCFVPNQEFEIAIQNRMMIPSQNNSYALDEGDSKPDPALLGKSARVITFRSRSIVKLPGLTMVCRLRKCAQCAPIDFQSCEEAFVFFLTMINALHKDTVSWSFLLLQQNRAAVLKLQRKRIGRVKAQPPRSTSFVFTTTDLQPPVPLNGCSSDEQG